MNQALQEKYPALKRQVIKAAVFHAILLAVALGLLFGLMQVRDSAVQNKSVLEGRLQGLQGEISQLQAQYTQATQSLALFDTLHAQGRTVNDALSREHARAIFDDLKKRYHFSVLKITMSPITKTKDEAYTPKQGSLVSSDVDVTFEGVTDEEVAALIQDLRRELPGFVRIKTLSMSKKPPADADPLRQLAQGVLPVLVQGEIKFQWLGVAFDKETNDKGPNALPAGGAP